MPLIEHEKCARDIRELRWHINFEGRKLHRQLGKEQTLSERIKLFAFDVNVSLCS